MAALLRLLLALLRIFGTIACASAGTYPSRPVRMIVAFPPGGGSDIVARTIGQKLVERWGQQVVVENRPGAGGIIGTEVAAAAPPDGYTLFLGTLGNLSVNKHRRPPRSPGSTWLPPA